MNSFYILSVGFHIATQTQYKASFSYRFPASISFRGSLIVTLQDGVRDCSRFAERTYLGVADNLESRPGHAQHEHRFRLGRNLFGISVQGEGDATALRFAMLSLFPPTFKGRENGMRIDIAEVRTNIFTALECSCSYHVVDRLWQK